MTGIGMFLALLFGLFVVIMFCDQMSCILQNTSTIDKLQKTKAEEPRSKKSSYRLIDEVMSGGHGFSIWWFIPCDIPNDIVVEREFE